MIRLMVRFAALEAENERLRQRLIDANHLLFYAKLKVLRPDQDFTNANLINELKKLDQRRERETPLTLHCQTPNSGATEMIKTLLEAMGHTVVDCPAVKTKSKGKR